MQHHEDDPQFRRLRVRIPQNLIHAIDKYVAKGHPPGGAMCAFLENDLVGAFSRGDMQTLGAMPDIVAYLVNYIPAQAWGSPEKVKDWIEKKGLEGASGIVVQ